MTVASAPTTGVRPEGSGLRRLVDVWGAFLRTDYLIALSYPISFVFSQIQTLVPVVVYHFVARLVKAPASSVGDSYFTFVVIGMIAARVLSGGLLGVGEALEAAVQEGRFEAFLVQPVRWRLLPFGLAEWPIVWRLVNAGVIVAISIPLGAHYRLAGLPVAIVVVTLGAAATMGVGILAAGVKLLAKRTDPILTVYQLAAAILAGVYYPVAQLPRAAQALSHLLPDFYVISALRKVLMPGGAALAGPSVGYVIVGLVAFNVVIYPVSLWLFGRSLEYGRTMGVLGGY